MLLVVVVIGLSIPLSRVDYDESFFPNEETTTVAFTNVNVVPMDSNHVLPNKTVLVEDGRITAVAGNTLTLPAGSKVIDAKGGYLLPGLADMHTHIFDRSDLTLYLASGVTTVRNMMGFPMHLRWKRQINEGDFWGPKLISASPTLNSGGNGGPFHRYVDTPSEAQEAAAKYIERGYDFIKVYDGLQAETFEAILKTAKQHNVSVSGHPPYAVDFGEVLESGLASLEHVEEIYQGPLDFKYDDTRLHELAQQIKEAGIYVTPTLSAYHAIYLATEEREAFIAHRPTDYLNPFIRFIGEKQLGDWIQLEDNSGVERKDAYLGDIVKVLQEYNVPLLLGTDTGPNLTIPGLTLHDEMDLYCHYGLSPYDVLRTGTYNAARYLGVLDEQGTVHEGKAADLILVENNPLDDLSTLRKPRGVMKQGQWFGEDDLDRMKEQAKEHSGIYITIGRFLDHVFSL